MMDNKLVRILLRIVRILLPGVAFWLCTIPGSCSYADTQNGVVSTNYLDVRVREVGGNWIPLVFALLSGLAIVMAIVCAFKETEKTLTWLSGIMCIAMVADLLMSMFGNLTVLGWVIAGIMAVAVALTAYQEILMEKKAMK